MKKNILSVIFFLLCILCIIIYRKFDNSNLDYIFIGDSDIYYKNNFKYEKYLYDSISYKSLKDNILNNDYKVIKEKNIYLNQVISNSDVIILSANNFSYFNKCKKSSRIIDEYDDILEKDIESLVDVISKISNAKIYVLGNYCLKGNYEQIFNSDKYVYISYKNVKSIDKIIKKSMYNWEIYLILLKKVCIIPLEVISITIN